MLDIYKQRYWNETAQKMEYLTNWQDCSYWGDCVLESVFNDPDDKNLMFCTGLKDVKGNLIFAGDILKSIYVSPQGFETKCVGYVEFNHCAFWFRSKNLGTYLDHAEYNNYEILGNIYENPELLNFTPQSDSLQNL